MDQAVARPIRLLGFVAAALTVANWAPYAHFQSDNRQSPLAERTIDVNHASAADLQLIPGVGPSIARRICQQRASSPFMDAADFESRVKGVGPSFMMNYGQWLTYSQPTDPKIQVSSVEQVASP